MAQFKESDGKSILHLAAEVAVSEEDLFFFSRLLDLKLPLYSLDADDCYPAFYLTQIQNDSKFLTAYYSITDAGFDVNRPNRAGQTFLQKLILESSSLSLNKVTGIV